MRRRLIQIQQGLNDVCYERQSLACIEKKGENAPPGANMSDEELMTRRIKCSICYLCAGGSEEQQERKPQCPSLGLSCPREGIVIILWTVMRIEDAIFASVLRKWCKSRPTPRGACGYRSRCLKTVILDIGP